MLCKAALTWRKNRQVCFFVAFLHFLPESLSPCVIYRVKTVLSNYFTNFQEHATDHHPSALLFQTAKQVKKSFIIFYVFPALNAYLFEGYSLPENG